MIFDTFWEKIPPKNVRKYHFFALFAPREFRGFSGDFFSGRSGFMCRNCPVFRGQIGAILGQIWDPEIPEMCTFCKFAKKSALFSTEISPRIFWISAKFHHFYEIYKRLQSETTETVKKRGGKTRQKKKFRKFRKSEKKWREISGGFFGVFLTFSDPLKITKINDYSPEVPFFGKTRKWRFREFREFRENFLPEFLRGKFFSQIFVKILLQFYKFIIDCSR